MPYGDYLQVKDNTETGDLEWFGMVPDIFNSMATYLNFTYSIALSRDGNWGKVDPETGEWNGFIKDILDDVVDLAAAAITVTKSRSQVVTFLLPFDSEQDSFFVSTKTSNSWTTYLLPFLYETWAVLLIMLVTLSIMFAFVAKMGKDKSIKQFTLEKCAIYVFGAYGGIAVRRWSITPVNISAR